MPAKRKRNPISVAKAADTRTFSTWEKKHQAWEKANSAFQADRRAKAKQVTRQTSGISRRNMRSMNAKALKKSQATVTRTSKVEKAAMAKWITANNKLRVALGKRPLSSKTPAARSDGTPR